MLLIGIVLITLFVALILTPKMLFGRKKSHKFRDRHVVITGGSQGIGLALAAQLCKEGARLTLIARSESKLATAKAELLRKYSKAAVCTISADVTQYASVQEAIKTAVSCQGDIYGLVCSAGSSTPGKFLQQDVSVFSGTMNLNYMGTVHALKAALPLMVQQQQGHIVVISSVMAIIGFTGYASYAPSKWAVRGLCDCLRNELAGTGVSLSIAYPPDTDTPGYALEKALMPEDGRAVQSLGGEELFPADKVAEGIVLGVQRGDYHIHGPDVGLNCLVAGMAGFTPRMYHWILECMLAPIMVIVASLGCWMADRIVRKHAAAGQTQQHPRGP